MMKKILVTTTMAVLMASAAAIPSAPAARALVPDMAAYNEVAAEDADTGSYDWRIFREYEYREPCQHYVMPPAPYVQIGCDLYKAAPPMVAMPQQYTVVEKQAPAPAVPMVSSYTVYFDFDKAILRADQVRALDLAATDIKRQNITHVTVGGHADTSGPADYNQRLSQRRAETVAKALQERGLSTQIISKEAYGETDLAVQTGDGVKLEENRRTVIDFRR